MWKTLREKEKLLVTSGGSVVSMSDSKSGGCEFDPHLRRLFFLAYFRLSPLQKHVRKVVSGFGKKTSVSTGVRKPGNTCVTDRHDMTLDVKVALNPNTTDQSTFSYNVFHSYISLVRQNTVLCGNVLTLYQPTNF